MGKKRSTFKKRLDDGILNAFAVVITVFPLLSIGYFTHEQFFGDPRQVVALQTIQPSSTPHLFEEGIVSVTFDDGWETIYSEGAVLFSEYNIPTTQFILPGLFVDEGYLSEKQAKSLKTAGHEITSHTMTHPVLTRVNIETARFELEESKRLLLEKGLSSGAMNFASPESETNSAVDKEIERLYSSHRNTFGDIENGIDGHDINLKSTQFDRYDIIGYTINSATTLDQIKAALRYAAANKGWLVLVYHQVDRSNSKYAVTPEALASHLRAIKNSNVKPATINDVLKNTSEGL